ncbi:MAG: hypothetical protein GWM98_29490 [Nitrospinaceae bacterium]|nr:hypothetical protein [Nitrospinaceae bacterium]NIR57834.1 hypothetical protein [Nitrospinaceae bacterium]NIT85175.1 hypothetical protein [Nitrospinaceae bacterium]NIU47328.1 hypothetical protein [Nitrospinaceae bacterium]NIU99545.1 hypothetical protein [Nitrospinaceae bacterium]
MKKDRSQQNARAEADDQPERGLGPEPDRGDPPAHHGDHKNEKKEWVENGFVHNPGNIQRIQE